jgi:predicted  nucleic acid-binding Zn-ribbon protein
MTTDQVKAYVDQQVKDLSDRKIKPLVQSIDGELAKQREFNDQKAAIDKQIAESNERIAEFQKYIGAAQTQVNDLATKLAEATSAAVTSGQE